MNKKEDFEVKEILNKLINKVNNLKLLNEPEVKAEKLVLYGRRCSIFKYQIHELENFLRKKLYN